MKIFIFISKSNDFFIQFLLFGFHLFRGKFGLYFFIESIHYGCFALNILWLIIIYIQHLFFYWFLCPKYSLFLFRQLSLLLVDIYSTWVYFIVWNTKFSVPFHFEISTLFPQKLGLSLRKRVQWIDLIFPFIEDELEIAILLLAKKVGFLWFFIFLLIKRDRFFNAALILNFRLRI